MAQIDQDLIDQLRVFGPESATALARRLAVSTPTVTRALKRLGDAVVAVGKGRASAYALRRNVRDLGHSWPLYKIGPDAEPVLLGTLQALQGRYRWRLAPEHPLPLFMRGEFADGLYEDLPWFLQALRPQGYLGRLFARNLAQKLSAPNDPLRWQGDDVLCALLHTAGSSSGNLVLGDHSLAGEQQFTRSLLMSFPMTPNEFHDRFPEIVESLEKSGPIGSSAAGERPKFFTSRLIDKGHLENLIIKFVRIDLGNPATRRWGELLLCEEQALHVLAGHGISSATSEIASIKDWLFLKSTRFDRTLQGGRIGIFDLDTLDTTFVGSDRSNWLAGALPLHTQGMIDADDIETIRLLDAFGRLIGNDDMHHGNLSFFAEPESERLKLAPVYDMLPMHYRPSPTGLTHDRPFALPQPDRAYRAPWEKAGAMAAAFWTAAAADPRLSADFAAICADNAERISAWRTEHGL